MCGLLPARWLPHTTLAIVSLLIGTLGLEGVAQVWLRSTRSPLHEWHPHVLYAHRPGAQSTFQRLPINGGQTIPIRINSRGFRGPELAVTKTLPRLIVYGDSLIAGEYSTEEATFVGQLQTVLQAQQQRSVTAINAGVVGYGPDQVALKLAAERTELQPDLIVVGLFADNDFGDLLRNKLFRMTTAQQLEQLHSQRAQSCRHPSQARSGEPMLWQLTRQAVRGLQAQQGATPCFMSQWRTQCEAEYTEFITRNDLLVRDLQADHFDADIALAPDAASARYKRQLMTLTLQHLAHAAGSVPVLAVVIPSPGDLLADYSFYDLRHSATPEYDPRRLSNWMTQAAEQAGIPVVNLYEPFARQGATSLYFQGGDNHWNDAGQALAAQLVAAEIARNGWLPRNRPLPSGRPERSPTVPAPLAN